MFSNCLFFLSNALSRELTGLWDNAFSELQLTASQAYMLVFVIRHPECNQSEIARQLLLEASTVTRSLGGLVARGLIQVRTSKLDARARKIQATSKGEGLEKRIVQISRSLNKRLQLRYGEARLEKIRRLTEELLLDPEIDLQETAK